MLHQSTVVAPQNSLATTLDFSLQIAEIEALKSGHYAAQMDLNKEQTAIVAADISQLKQEVLQLQEEVGLASGHDRLRDRVALLDKGTSDCFDKHTKTMAEFMQSHDGHRASFEARVSSIEVAIHEMNIKEVGEISRRLSLLEQGCRDVADNHRNQINELQAASDKNGTDLLMCREALCRRIESVEQGVKDSALTQVEICAASLKSYEGPLPERLGFLEKQFAASVDRMDRMSSELRRCADGARRAGSEDAALHRRMVSLESDLAKLPERCGRELDKVARELTGLNSKLDIIAERVACLERQLGEAAGKLTVMSEETGAVRAGILRDVQGWLSTIREILDFFEAEIRHLWSKHEEAIDDVRRTNDDNICKNNARHVAVVGRMDSLEKTLTELFGKYCSSMTDMQHEHSELSIDSESVPHRAVCLEQQQQQQQCDSKVACASDSQRSQDQCQSRIDEIEGESDGWRASVASRVGALQRAVRDEAGQHVEGLADLRQAHLEHTGRGPHNAGEARAVSAGRQGSEQSDVRGELLWHGTPTPSEGLPRPRAFSPQDRVTRAGAEEAQRKADARAALVSELTRSASSPSLSAASLGADPGGQGSPHPNTWARGQLCGRALRAFRPTRPSQDVEGGRCELRPPRSLWWAQPG